MPAPALLFAVPAIAAVADLAPRAIAEVIERGGVLKGAKNPPGFEATLRAEKLMDELRQNARATAIYKKTL